MIEQGREEDAGKLMAECFQLREGIQGPGHPDTLSSFAALAGEFTLTYLKSSRTFG